MHHRYSFVVRSLIAAGHKLMSAKNTIGARGRTAERRSFLAAVGAAAVSAPILAAFPASSRAAASSGQVGSTIVKKCRHGKATFTSATENYIPDQCLIDEVLKFEDDCVKTYNIGEGETYDNEKGISYYAKGSAFRMFDFMTPREWSGNEVPQHFAEVMGNYSGHVDLQDIKVHATPTLAFVSMIQHVYGTNRKTGKPYDVTLRCTDGLVKMDGKWTWVHQHLSFPVDWSTGRADFDSKPGLPFGHVSPAGD
jgi:ketosteroid isomerase-like protein